MGPESFDGWAGEPALGLPPLRIGAGAVAAADHVLRLDDPEPALGGLLDDLARRRGYRDGKAQGGGLSLFLAGLPLALTLRWLDGHPVPALDVSRTRCHLNAYGNVIVVELDRTPSVDRPDIEELAARLVALLAPAYAAIRVATRFSVVNQWAQYTSGLLDLLLNSATPDAEATAFVDALTQAHPTLRRARPRVGWVSWQGQPRPYALRRVCCFNYRGTSGSYCGSLCPLVEPEERDRAARLAWAG